MWFVVSTVRVRVSPSSGVELCGVGRRAPAPRLRVALRGAVGLADPILTEVRPAHPAGAEGDARGSDQWTRRHWRQETGGAEMEWALALVALALLAVAAVS